MSNTEIKTIEEFANQEYKYGFVSDIESDSFPKGLNEDVIRKLSKIKEEPDWLTEWRLKAYRFWLTMEEPHWANIHYNKIDYQDIIYYSAPKKKPKLSSLDEVDPEGAGHRSSPAPVPTARDLPPPPSCAPRGPAGGSGCG